MSAAIFNSGAVKILKDILKFKSGNQITMQGTIDPTAISTSGIPGDLYIRSSNGAVYKKLDSGSSVNWLELLDSAAVAAIVAAYIPLSQKGAANGVVPLNGGGKIDFTYLPSSLLIYKGQWNATTNTPTLIDGTGTSGWVYEVSVAGTQNLGSGAQTFKVGDWIVYDGTKWDVSTNSNEVVSVNGLTGAVTLTTTNIAEGTSLYFTDERAQDAVGAAVASTATIGLTYNDAANQITADVVAGSISNTQLSTGIDATKIADGTVTSVEFQYINTLSSNVQSQINGLVAASGAAPALIVDVAYYVDAGIAASAPATFQSYTPSVGHIILSVTNSEFNGPWVWNGAGVAMNRHPSFDTAAKFKPGSLFIVRPDRTAPNVGFPQGRTFVVRDAVATLGVSPINLDVSAFNPLFTPLLTPMSDGASALGSGAKSFSAVHTHELSLSGSNSGFGLQTFPATASNLNINSVGSSANVGLLYGFDRAISVTTANNTASDASITNNVVVSTGNKTVGTGNSGSVNLKTGTATGIRGKIILDGLEIDVSSKKITNLATPTVSTDAVNKSYADSLSSNISVNRFNGNGSLTTVNLTSDPGTENNTNVYISGVYQQKDTYSLVGTALTFDAPPPTGTNNIEVIFGSTLPIGTPADNTVSTIKIQDLAVTTAKLLDTAVTQAKLGTLTAPTIQKFTSGTGTYTTPAGVRWIKVRMVGAGGGGGGSNQAGTAGGSGGAGGNTTFGLHTANGGSGGPNIDSGGAGGGATLGAGGIGLEFAGARGTAGAQTSGSTDLKCGGDGAQTPFGGAGPGGRFLLAGASATANTGSAGGGGGSGNNGGNYNTGAGGGAGGYLDFMIGTPAATYSYGVGAGGTSGTAGTNGYVGGLGAAGIIIVEEHYN